MMIKRLPAVIFLIGMLLSAAPVFAQVSINLIAVNASENEQKEIEVRFDLPDELEPADVLDTGGLEMKYDVDKKVYYAGKSVLFLPKESRQFKIRVKDVWKIGPEEIQELKNQLDSNLEMLSKHESYQAAKEARDYMSEQLDFIMAQQDKYSGNVDRRIEEYRAYRAAMEELKNNIYSLDFLRFESKALKEIKENRGTVKLVLEVTNPHPDTRSIKHKHFLPLEIRAENVIDQQDFDVRFDEEAERAYLTKEEEFGPNETKRYSVVIQDIWQFPVIKVDDLLDRALIATEELQSTIYQESANRLITNIQDLRQKISDSQASQAGLPVADHIGSYRLDAQRYEEARRDFKRIEEMIAIVRAKKLEELEQKKVKNVLQRLKALRGLSALAEALFKKSISVTVTWRIIMGAIIFVAVFTTIHFIIWSKRSGKLGEEMGSDKGEAIRVVPKPGQGKDEEDTSSA